MSKKTVVYLSKIPAQCIYEIFLKNHSHKDCSFYIYVSEHF